MAEGERKKGSLSFGFSKKKETSKLRASAIVNDENSTVKEDSTFVDSFDGKQLNRQEKKELVIPLITTNRWQTPIKPGPDDVDEDCREDPEKTAKKVQGDSIESQAANELLAEASHDEAKRNAEGKRDPNLKVPLLVANKVPEGYETDERLNVALRPDESVAADYDQIPIEDYGLAMLRGMGWKEGMGIGKRGRQAKPIDAVQRPKGMGLGADRNLAKQLTANGAESSDRDAEQLSCKKGVHCVIINGRHKDLYGVIEGVDEDNSRIVVKMTLSGERITINQFGAKLVTKKDYDKNAKVLNKVKVDKYKEEEESKKEKERSKAYRSDERSSHEDRGDERDRRKDRARDRDSHRGSSEEHQKERKRKHDDSSCGSSSKSKSSREPMWLRPHLRVRIVDPEFRKGKYFKSKVVIEDVVGQGKCICRTDDGKVLEDVRQSMLETVIPRADPAYVMVVEGKHAGQLGEVLRKDKASCKAVVQLLEDRDKALALDFDVICDYTGNIDDDFHY